ncbi:MAG: FtsH protease activity modulator HflK [Gemmatimonadetes bacterium]|nr:FtsH protease activity modulator HflK [Gemmatimonadota bacterium]
MPLVTDWLLAIWVVLCESGPFLVIGFLIAGYLKILIPEDKVFEHLGKSNMRSVAIASCCGVPIPLCSCSVVPTAVALKRSGASKGATTSFLISTPETGVDSIGVTWALMDPVMTIMRPISALVTAMTAGSLVNTLEKRGWDENTATESEEDGCDCATNDRSDDSGGLEPNAIGFSGKSWAAARYAFGPLMADLTPSFVFGFVLSALIMVLIPENFIGDQLPGGWISMLAMLAVGIPVYICATASTPVAAALVAKGLDPGAALVFLLAGPATNIATLNIVKNLLGKRVLFVYLGSIAACALVMGWFLNGVYATLRIEPSAIIRPPEELGWLSIAGGLALAGLLLRHSIELDLARRFARDLRRLFAPIGIDPTSRTSRFVSVSILVVLWASSGLTAIGAGETGFVLRFGAVKKVLESPGLHWHLPYPIDHVERVRSDEIRGFALGPARADTLGRSPFPGEIEVAPTEVMVGDENVLQIGATVHYRVADPYSFRFGVAAPERSIRFLAEASLRRMAAHRTASEVLVANRPALEAEVASSLQVELDGIGAGIEVVAVNLLDIHAPADVHEAFRDVASSLEDKERQIIEAEKYRIERVAQARASAHTSERLAEADEAKTIDGAKGEVAAFVGIRDVMAESDRITRFRLRMEAAELSLRGSRSVFVLDHDVDVVLTSEERGLRAATRGPFGP